MILGFGLGIQEMIVCGIVAVLLFGKRLPEVARSVGQSYEQFRRNLRDIQTEVDSAVRAADNYTPRSTVINYPDDHDDDSPSAPRFEPPQLTGPETHRAPDAATESEDVASDEEGSDSR